MNGGQHCQQVHGPVASQKYTRRFVRFIKTKMAADKRGKAKKARANCNDTNGRQKANTATSSRRCKTPCQASDC